MGHKVGDKVSIKDYETPFDPFKKRQNKQWSAVPGVIVGHTCEYIYVATTGIGDDRVLQRVVRKENNNL